MIFKEEVYGDIKHKIKNIQDNISGIYFLKYNGSISYIGQSICIKRRLIQHLIGKEKPFNDFEFIETESQLLDSVESFYILYHSPAFNKSHCLQINSKDDFVSKNKLESLFISAKEYYEEQNVNKRLVDSQEYIPTQKELEKFYGVTERTLRNWAKATDGRQHLLQAAKQYYIATLASKNEMR